MSITDQIGMIEAERDRLKAENETLKTRIAKQAGALDESRAQVRQLIMRNEKLRDYNATLKEHFHNFHGTAERIAAQHQELAAADKTSEPTVAEQVNAPDQIETIKSRVRRLIAGEEKTAAPTNGQAA